MPYKHPKSARALETARERIKRHRERQRKLRQLRNLELHDLLLILAHTEEGKEILCRLVSVKLDKRDVESGVTTFRILEEKNLDLSALLRAPEEKVLYRATYWLSVRAIDKEKYEKLLKELKFTYPIAISKKWLVLKPVSQEYAEEFLEALKLAQVEEE